MDMRAAVESTRKPSCLYFMLHTSRGKAIPPDRPRTGMQKEPPLYQTEAAPDCRPKCLPRCQPLTDGSFFVQLAAMLQAL